MSRSPLPRWLRLLGRFGVSAGVLVVVGRELDVAVVAERLSGVDPKASRALRSTRVAEWINEQVKNKKARYWWIAYAKVRKALREQFFGTEAKSAGQDDCPLAKLLFAKPAASRPTGAASSLPATKK